MAGAGFSNTKESCCGGGGTYNFDLFDLCGTEGVLACSNPATYTNWDGIHLTEAAYKLSSDFIVNQPKYTIPHFSSLTENACPWKN